jgi:hypothetical protein
MATVREPYDLREGGREGGREGTRGEALPITKLR